MNWDIFVWVLGAICGAGGVIAGGSFWFGRHVSTVEDAIKNLNTGLNTLVITVQNIGSELKDRDTLFREELEKRDDKIEALGKRHDDLKERVVIVEHTIKNG